MNIVEAFDRDRVSVRVSDELPAFPGERRPVPTSGLESVMPPDDAIVRNH